MALSNSEPDAKFAEYGLGSLLRIPYQAMMTDAVEPALIDAGFTDIRSAHLPVIHSLAANPEGMRATDLAGYARMTKQSMGSLVDHLEAGGYVERVPDQTDHRAKVVRLTPHGWALSGQIRASVREVEDELAGRIGTERFEQLRSILRELAASYER